MISPVRKAFLALPPLVLAAVLLIHPTDESETIYASVRDDVNAFVTVHVALLFAFPLLGLATYALLHGLHGRAATVSRVAIVFFLVFYTAWEVMAGLTTGILARSANAATGAEQAGIAGAIEDLNHHWITQVSLALGSLGWIVAMVAAAIAVRAVGVRWPGLVLVTAAAAFAVHPPPVGPVALVAFAAGALLVERARATRAAVPESPAMAMPGPA